MALLIRILIGLVIAFIIYFILTSIIHFAHAHLIFGLIAAIVGLAIVFGSPFYTPRGGGGAAL